MMKKKKDKRQKIPFYKYTKGGRISTLMAIVSVVVLAVAIGIAIAKRGNAGIIVGILGIATFAIAMAGFVVGIESFKEETKFLRYSWIGTMMNLVMWLVMLMIFLIFR